MYYFSLYPLRRSPCEVGEPTHRVGFERRGVSLLLLQLVRATQLLTPLEVHPAVCTAAAALGAAYF